MSPSGARLARVEVLAGVTAFAFALVTWTVQLFAPVYYYSRGSHCLGPCPRRLFNIVDNDFGGFKYFVSDSPGSALLILSLVVFAGVVALGTYLHGARHVGAARWLIWCASVLLALLLPLVASIMSDLGSGHTIAPFQLGSSLDLHWDTLLLGLVLCVGLAVLVSVIAAASRPEAKTEARAGDDTSPGGATVRSTPR